AGKRVTVMGLGRFGGGVGVARFLADRGADVLVTDLEPEDKLQPSVEQIRDLIDVGVVTLRLGEHNVSDFTTCDLVVVNPAVKPGNRFVRAAEAAGIEVTTEIRLLVQRLPNRLRTIGVTGSAGKSTVTAMIGHVLGKVFERGGEGSGSTPRRQDAKTPSKADNPKVWVGGNIGVSLLPVLDQIGEDDWVVLELSSFMLERLKADAHFAGWSPHIAVITNISPNHLDWHGSMEAYVAAKQVILDYQIEDVGYQEVAVLGPGAASAFRVKASEQFRWDLGRMEPWLMPRDWSLAVPGRHNRLNALIVSQVVVEIDDQTETEAALSDFPGLPHRLQLVTKHDGVRYFNDSKCTTPEAAMLAIQAFTEDDGKPGIHLILGGKDKGSDMKPLAGLAAQQCKAVYTIGALGDTLAGLCEDAASRSLPERPNTCGGVSWPAESAEIVRCDDLDTAVAQISKRVKAGDVVLLSPACASWDQFENYEQRGERFIELVQQHIDRAG
ncbi:MAG: UDP-N-acetylmuramoyl-L-alanine--D-glutamate ligase, partial [Planctomycetota bacterium]